MVLPLVLGALALGGTIWAINSILNNKFITVLGGRGVGKTTLLHYLKTKQIKDSHEQTHIDAYDAMSIEIDGTKMSILGGNDVGGSSFLHPEWKKEVNKAEVIFYLLNIDKVIKKDESYINDVNKDINAIEKEVRGKKQGTKIFLLATHADKQMDYSKDYAKFEKKVHKLALINTIILKFGGKENCKVVIGSLKNSKEAESLMKKVLSYK